MCYLHVMLALCLPLFKRNLNCIGFFISISSILLLLLLLKQNSLAFDIFYIFRQFCHINQLNIVGKRSSKREIKCSRCCDGNLCNRICDISRMNDSKALSTVSIVNVSTLTTKATKTSPVCIDNGGTEFVLMFIPNFDHTREHIELLITSFDGKSDIKLISSVVGISSNISLHKKSMHVNIPNASIQHDARVQNKGLYIKSSNPISVHGISVYSPGCCTSGGFTALPLRFLGTDYIVVSGLVFKLSQIGLVASHDNTVVKVTLNTTSLGCVQFYNQTYTNGETISLSLNKLDTVQLGSTADLTGTKIQSNNPIGVLSGNQCDKVISDDCDFSVAMLPPVTKWGRKFVVPSINPTRVMVLRVVPSENDVRIELLSNITDIIYPATSNTIEVRLLSLDVTIVYCSKPCLVVQFSADTFMTLVPPIEQFSRQYILETPSLKSFSNYALITIETKYASGLRYNGNPVPGAFRTITDRQNISWTSITMPIGNSTNVLEHTSSNVYFGVLQYGFQYSIAPEAYAFPVSFRESCSN